MLARRYNRIPSWAKARAWIALVWMFCAYLPQADAAVPITLYQSFAGNLNFQMTGASLRTQSNGGDACAVVSTGTTVNATLAGIPAGATIQAAYLYWAGSGTTVDSQVVFQGVTTNATRTFTETFSLSGTDYDFFSGFADVTALVSGNGSYGLSGLSVNTGNPHCPVQAVLAGWSLIVVYEHASQPLRVINVFDGFRYFRASNIDLTPGNFRIPASGCGGGGDCKLGILSWEGDVENSASLGGFDENLYINPPPPPAALTATNNPANNQYNSTISLPDVVGPPNSTTAYGVDIDVYPLTSPTHLSPGDTNTVVRYESGGDLVLLSAEVLSVRNVPVADLSINKAHSGNFVAGQQGVYTITVSNNGPNATSAGSTVTVTDNLPAGLSYVSATGSGWSCGASGQLVTCTRNGALANGASLPAITLTVNVSAAAAPSVNNVASVSSNSTTFDNQPGNDSSSDAANVIVPNLSGSTKSVLDLNGGDANPGDTLRYTITITESAGAAISGVSVTDNISALLTNFTVINNGGGTDSSTPGSGPLNITNISVPASGSVTVVFEATVAGTASPGNIIANTAVINNPVAGTNTNASAPNVIVSASSIPGVGVKNLYTYFVDAGGANANTLQRIVPSSESTQPLLDGNGGNFSLIMTPPTQSALTLGAGNIQVLLCMDRNNSSGGSGRNINVALDYFATGVGGSTDVIGNQTQNGILTSNGFQLVTFTINLAANVTLNANTAIRMRFTNNSPANNRRVRLSSDACGTISRVALNANTVINVESVAGYDNVAYPGGSVQPSFVQGETLRLRALVSDPFGSFDITSSNIQIIDPNSNTVVPLTVMTQVNDSGVASKTYEYIFTVPAAGPNGNWTVRVTANEGTEGTISDVGVGTFLVGMPSISVMKLSTTFSDPVNNPSYPNSDAGANPKAIPGAIVEYRVIVTNSGAGRADLNSIVITDALPSQVNLFFGNPVNPVQFSNGTPISGLTFTFNNLADNSDDVDFSNDGGSTFITPTVDANGFDATVPPVNFIRINPKGRLNGSIGSGNPNFNLIFRGRVQ